MVSMIRKSEVLDFIESALYEQRLNARSRILQINIYTVGDDDIGIER